MTAEGEVQMQKCRECKKQPSSRVEKEIDLSQWRSDSNNTGYVGVHERNCRFHANIWVRGQGAKYLGAFSTAEEAAEEFARAYLKQHGGPRVPNRQDLPDAVSRNSKATAAARTAKAAAEDASSDVYVCIEDMDEMPADAANTKNGAFVPCITERAGAQWVPGDALLERNPSTESGFGGVYRNDKRWQAHHRTTNIGTFETAVEAARARHNWVVTHFHTTTNERHNDHTDDEDNNATLHEHGEIDPLCVACLHPQRKRAHTCSRSKSGGSASHEESQPKARDDRTLLTHTNITPIAMNTKKRRGDPILNEPAPFPYDVGTLVAVEFNGSPWSAKVIKVSVDQKACSVRYGVDNSEEAGVCPLRIKPLVPCSLPLASP